MKRAFVAPLFPFVDPQFTQHIETPRQDHSNDDVFGSRTRTPSNGWKSFKTFARTAGGSRRRVLWYRLRRIYRCKNVDFFFFFFDAHRRVSFRKLKTTIIIRKTRKRISSIPISIRTMRNKTKARRKKRTMTMTRKRRNANGRKSFIKRKAFSKRFDVKLFLRWGRFAFFQLKSKRKDEERATRQQQKKSVDAKIGALTKRRAGSNVKSRLEAKTLRRSTSVKRVELEKRQKERQERRHYLKGVASLRNTGEVRRLTQEELLEEAKLTGKTTIARFVRL